MNVFYHLLIHNNFTDFYCFFRYIFWFLTIYLIFSNFHKKVIFRYNLPDLVLFKQFFLFILPYTDYFSWFCPVLLILPYLWDFAKFHPILPYFAWILTNYPIFFRFSEKHPIFWCPLMHWVMVTDFSWLTIFTLF